MPCNKIKQPDFTKEQIGECTGMNDGEGCKHLSKRKVWCSNFGVWIHEPERGKEKRKYPSIIKRAGSFGKAVVEQTLAGNPKRNDEEIARCMTICMTCNNYNKIDMKCYECGCNMPIKIPWETQHCKLGKF